MSEQKAKALAEVFREHAQSILRMKPSRCENCGDPLQTLADLLLDYDPELWAQKALEALEEG